MVFKIQIMDTEKLELLRKWYKWFYDAEPIWNEGLGCEIAYLLGAILNDTSIEVDADSPLFTLLRQRKVESDDLIWKYISFPSN